MTQSKTELPMGIRSTFGVPEKVMAIEVPLNEEISVSKNGRGKEINSAICRRKANRGSITLKKAEVKQRKVVESSEKDRPCPAKIMTPRQAWRQNFGRKNPICQIAKQIVQESGKKMS